MTRQPAHIRGNRISGNIRRLNDKAIKVLAVIKFSPQSLTREEIMETTSLTKIDVERQVRLLLAYQLINTNNMFPHFPRLGWRVYTETRKHTQIIQILRSHGYQDERSQRTREVLGGYYPTGMALEGKGRQPNNRRGYPPKVPENEDLDYREQTMDTMMKWRDEIKPFRPKEYSPEAITEKRRKFQWIISKLSTIYGIRQPNLIIGKVTKSTWNKSGSSGSSNYSPTTHTITINGKFSIITLLHEFAHARNMDEVDATLWSVNLFKRIFPKSYSRLSENGHTLVLGERETQFTM